MPGDAWRVAKFGLPDDWEPEDVWCVTLAIPAGAQYVDNLMAALRLLTYSQNFERDPTMTGAATVCRTWERALNLRPPVVETGDCMSFDMRVKPGQPWATEVSTDGGLTWHDAIIQAHWPTSNAPSIAPTIGQAQDSAAAIQRQFGQQVTQILTDNAGNETLAKSKLTSLLNPYTNGAGATLTPLVNAAWDSFSALSDPEKAAYLDDCTYADQYANFFDWLWNYPGLFGAALDNAIASWVNQATLDFDKALSNLAASLGSPGLWDLVTADGQPAAGSGADFCGFAHNFDFTVDDGGFVGAFYVGEAFPAAVYTDKWRGVQGDWILPTVTQWFLSIKRALPVPKYLNEIDFEYFITGAVGVTYINVQYFGDADTTRLLTSVGNNDTLETLNWTGQTERQVISVEVGVQCAEDEGTGIYCNFCLIAGSGSDPF